MKGVRALPSAEDNGIGLAWVQGKAIETEPDVKIGETLFKFSDVNDRLSLTTATYSCVSSAYCYRERPYAEVISAMGEI